MTTGMSIPKAESVVAMRLKTYTPDCLVLPRAREIIADLSVHGYEIEPKPKDMASIDASLARQLRRSMERNARLSKALQDIKDMCVGEKSPNWKDDWATVKSREKIINICDAAAQQKE